jgi:hypothetical protein
MQRLPYIATTAPRSQRCHGHAQTLGCATVELGEMVLLEAG